MNMVTDAKSQLEHMQKKLDKVRDEYQELEDVRAKQLQGLIQFSMRLGLCCKGQNLELDNRLAKIRHLLSDTSNLDTALPEMGELSRALQTQYQNTQRDIEHNQQAMQQLARQLSSLSGIPDKLKRELKYYQLDIQKPIHTVWEIIPRVEKLVKYYEQLLQERLAKEDRIPTTPKHRQLAHELSQLLAEIEFPGQHGEVINAIKAMLSGDVQVDQLLEAYSQVLNILVGEMAKEKSASQQFLSALTDSLSVVRQAMNENWQASSNSYKSSKLFNQKLNSHVGQFSEKVAEAEELSALKTQVINELTFIRQQLSKRDNQDQQEFMAMKQSMQKMQAEISALASEAASYKDKLIEQQRLNQVDALTQLPNRAALDEQLKRSYRQFKRYGHDLWVTVADIDRFKSINDNFGHSTGDKTLQVVSMALKNSLRKEEFVARYGGEEFVVLLPGLDKEQVQQVLNRIRERIKAIPFKFRDERLSITVSIGAAKVGSNETIQETFERADAALYRAKRQGRDKVELDD
ncbi:diguanylate cyclase (GGDEF) domain-containing protein [Ferrimonas sediminum]|uniref:diguanylate cyclase n=1 Tax=Ferrimonas sediminum TaxID=718193 RepID=A0A1G8QGA3_9GAMM|nr:GGDEF domain-containing protein [Ferrimonas sediminum]SDJ03804.1 diguanylate cyclase (GGDEF) domain-containing protein [Ferrimonas sediminum]